MRHATRVSIGISFFPTHGSEIDRLLNNADAAMYACKQNKNINYVIYSGESYDEDLHNPWIKFSDEHLIGVSEIDNQHNHLIVLANGLNDAVKRGDSSDILNGLYDELLYYTQFHFSTEERYMRDYQYPGEQLHRQEHTRLLQETAYVSLHLGRDGDALMLQTIKDWLMNHILASDKALGRYLNDRGVT